MKKYIPIFTAILIALSVYGLIAANVTETWEYATEGNKIKEATMLNGVTANGDSDILNPTQQNQLTFSTVYTGTATVTLQCSPNSGTTWITEHTFGTSETVAFPFLLMDQCKINVAGCAGCTVSTWYKGIWR